MKDTPEFIEVAGATPPDAAAAKIKAFRVKTKAPNGKAKPKIKGTKHNHKKTSNADLAAMNAEYAVVRVSGKTMVMEFEESPARRGVMVPVYSSFENFKKFHDKYRVAVTDENGETEMIGRGTWWLNNPERQQYRAVVFEPGASEEKTRGKFNLWRGFAVEPKYGDCSLYLAHLRDNICSGNPDHYQYLLNWMAWGVQNPGERAEVAIVLRGGEGAGKGIAVKTYGSLFGAHFVHATKPDHVVGKFNAHLQQCSVLFADEAFFAGDRSSEGHLKGVITEETIRIEPKGIDSFEVRNCLHVLMSSNSDWVIPAGADARRYFVLSVSEAHKQDHAYFEAIARERESGGREALLYYLVNRDLKSLNFNIRAVPQTVALAEQKAYSRRGIDALIEKLATEGEMPVARVGYPNVTITSGEAKGEGFYPAARKLVPDLKHMSSIVLKRRLKEEWGCKHWHGGSDNGIEFPPLDQLRAIFEAKHGPQEWPEVAEWTE